MKNLRGTRATKLPLTIFFLVGLGQYDSLGEYCSPHIASCVFLVLIFRFIHIFDFKKN